MADDLDGDKRGHGGNQGGPANWLALLFVLALAAIAIVVVNQLIKQVNIQNCVLSGRRDCVEIVPDDR